MKKYITLSDAATRKFASQLSRKMVQKNHSESQVFALTGQLGAGKTTFVQGFAKGLGIKEKITSPTFVLIRQHKIPNSQKKLFHIDLYRLENPNDLKGLDLEEILSNPDNIVLIEWAEKIKNLLPKKIVQISFEIIDQNSRKIKIFSI